MSIARLTAADPALGCVAQRKQQRQGRRGAPGHALTQYQVCRLGGLFEFAAKLLAGFEELLRAGDGTAQLDVAARFLGDPYALGFRPYSETDPDKDSLHPGDRQCRAGDPGWAWRAKRVAGKSWQTSRGTQVDHLGIGCRREGPQFLTCSRRRQAPDKTCIGVRQDAAEGRPGSTPAVGKFAPGLRRRGVQDWRPHPRQASA
jgi:hypothetical protein